MRYIVIPTNSSTFDVCDTLNNSKSVLSGPMYDDKLAELLCKRMNRANDEYEWSIAEILKTSV